MTLFKSKVKPSDTEVNEKKDEKKYNSSIIPTDDDDCTITIIVPPTARPVNSRYSVQYLKQFQNENVEDYSPGRLGSSVIVKPALENSKYSWKYCIIISFTTILIITGLLSYHIVRTLHDKKHY
uniref:Imidazoleglycerol-phosphate dehydratase n=1 Tax=Anthurium amnicola TaxID=1678845 RepID=A0A1D1ZB62_9ARAE